MEQKPDVEPGVPADYSAMVEEIRQLREEVAEAKKPRGLFSRLGARIRGIGPWLVNGLAPVGDADQVENQNALVQFLARKMSTRRGKLLILMSSAGAIIFWGVVLMLIMR